LQRLNAGPYETGASSTSWLPKKALDVLDQPSLDTERHRVRLRIHLEGATQKPHHMRLPLEQSARNEYWKHLGKEPRHVLSEECTKQLHDLRHCCPSLLMMNGADPNDVADFRIQKYLYDAPVRTPFAALFGG